MDKKLIYSYLYRTSFEKGLWLLIIRLSIKDFVITFRPDLLYSSFSQEKVDEFHNDIIAEANSQPYYVFCGVGFSN